MREKLFSLPFCKQKKYQNSRTNPDAIYAINVINPMNSINALGFLAFSAFLGFLAFYAMCSALCSSYKDHTDQR